jgi:hypothetical protein
MSRNALISFQKSLTDNTPATVELEQINTLVLRDVMLSEFMRLSRSIPKMSGNTIGTGIYEHRQTLLRIVERLDCRPHPGTGRSTMLIGTERLTVGEVETIQQVLSQYLGYDNKELLKQMKPSGAALHVSIRRECMERILKYALDAGYKPAVVANAA